MSSAEPPSSPPAGGPVLDEPRALDLDKPREWGPAARRARRLASALYYLGVGGLAAASVTQVTRQIFFSDTSAPSAQIGACVNGQRELLGALVAGRDAANEPAATGDAELALARFRAVVEPVWRAYPRVRATCASEPRMSPALDALERLRYAEEHGLRTHTTEVVLSRQVVRELLGELPASPPLPAIQPRSVTLP